MCKEMSAFIREAVMSQRDRSGVIWDPHQIDFDRVADDVQARMDELRMACSHEVPPWELMDERAASRGTAWRPTDVAADGRDC